MLRYCAIGLLWPACVLAGEVPPQEHAAAPPATQPSRYQFDELMNKYLDLNRKLRGTDDLSKKGEWRRELSETVRRMLELQSTRPPAMQFRAHPFLIDPLPNWQPPAGSVPREFNGVRYWVMPLNQQDPFVQRMSGKQNPPFETDEFRDWHVRTHPIGPLILPSDPQHVNNRPQK